MLRKFYIASLSIIVLALVALISCSKQEPDNPPTPTPPQTVAVESVSLSKSSAQMKVGESLTLTATVSPSNATDKKVSWSSSNATVASVTEGTVKALKAGNATITARTNSGGKTATCELTIQIDTVYVTDVVLSNKSTQMAEGDTLKLSATVLPDNATNKNLTWSSSNTSVATVANGLVTAIQAGETNIIATSEDGDKKDSCAVTVIAKESFVRVEGVNLYVSTTTLRVGETTAYTAEIVPPEATNKNVTWHSSNNSVATIDATGTITAVAPGSTEISVTTEDGGFTASNYFTVVEKGSAIPVQWFEFKNYKTDFYTGEVYTYEVVAHPENATNKSAVWSSSNTSIATIDNNGTLTAIAPGNADITIASADGSCSSVITITVQQKIPVTGITLGYTQKYMGVGEIIYLFPQIEPEDATVQTIKWSSSNPDVATIHENGEVTAHSIGEAEITATSEDSGVKASCKIYVVIPVQYIEFTNLRTEFTVGDVYTFTTNVYPENATYKELIWSSSNKEVATIDNGTLKAIAPGKTEMTITSQDKYQYHEYEVNVYAKVPVTGITISESNRNMRVGDIAYLYAEIKPDNASNKNKKWSSSNPAVATVNEHGEVNAIATGETEITVTTEDGGHKATCKISVIVPVEWIDLQNLPYAYFTGMTYNISAKVHPENATNKTLVWDSSDKSVATVDNNGTLTTIKTGYTQITIKVANEDHMTGFDVVVKDRVPVTGVSFNDTYREMHIGETIGLWVNVQPEDASVREVTWSSSNPAIATIDEWGNVTAVALGETEITATTKDGGFKATCTVKVGEYAPEYVELNEYNLEIKAGETAQLTATVYPENAVNKNVKWSSSNADVATVDNNGIVTAVAHGWCSIAATTEVGGRRAECQVYVPQVAVTGISFDSDTASVFVGSTLKLNPKISPNNATNKNVWWNCSDWSIAEIENGSIKGVRPGVVTITASTEEGGFEASCKVTVKPVGVTGISLSQTSAELTQGDVITLTATITPSNATNKNVIWSSSSDGAKVENGKVTAVRAGEVTITAKTEEGGYTATCKLYIKAQNGVDIGEWGEGGNNEGTAN